MILILFGPPGSGKGTQAQYLVDNMNFQHISTGDLLRNEIKQNTDLGNQVKGIMDAGLYVPDDIIIKIVDNIIAKEPEKNYIFDGFPRTLNQALAMEQLLGVRHLKVDLVIDFSVNLEELVQRISGRFSCAVCGTVYHDKFNKPKVAGVCNKCQATSFVRRQDDDETVVKRRIEVYLEETEVVRDYYTQKGALVTINASKNLDDVKSNIKDCLSQVGFTI